MAARRHEREWSLRGARQAAAQSQPHDAILLKALGAVAAREHRVALSL